MKKQTAAERQRRLAEETARFLARGGRIEVAATGAGRLNPVNEDRHNNFLFLGRKR